MYPKILFALLLALPVLYAAEPEAPKENKADVKRENLDGIDFHKNDEKIYWERRKKAVEKQRAEEAAALKAKEPPKPQDSTPPIEAKPETAPAK